MDDMIGKTTAAANAAMQSIRKVISSSQSGEGFAAQLKEQSERVAAARGGNTAAMETAAPQRVPVGRRGIAAEAGRGETLSGRTPVGARSEPKTPAREPLMPGMAASPTPASGTMPGPDLSTADTAVDTTGSISNDARTNGMYVPSDFYRGNSYSPVFDKADENGNMVRTPRFEGQVVYSDWRGSLPEDFDPNARVLRDPQTFGNTPVFWQKNDDGSWSKRETGYGGIPLYSNGKPVFTPDPKLYPEYFKA